MSSLLEAHQVKPCTVGEVVVTGYAIVGLSTVHSARRSSRRSDLRKGIRSIADKTRIVDNISNSACHSEEVIIIRNYIVSVGNVAVEIIGTRDHQAFTRLGGF